MVQGYKEDTAKVLVNGQHVNTQLLVNSGTALANIPSDPLFYLHHANVDRIWSQWQARANAEQLSNMTDILQPERKFLGSAVVFNVPLASVVWVGDLNCAYK